MESSINWIKRIKMSPMTVEFTDLLVPGTDGARSRSGGARRASSDGALGEAGGVRRGAAVQLRVRRARRGDWRLQGPIRDP